MRQRMPLNIVEILIMTVSSTSSWHHLGSLQCLWL